MKDITEVQPTADNLEGEMADKDKIANRILTITDYVFLPSSYENSEDFVVVQAKLGNALIKFSGGVVITKKLKNIEKSELPFSARLTLKKGKAGRSYWDLTEGK